MNPLAEPLSQPIPPEGLRSAFEQFNAMSAQLAQSYNALQDRVNQLNNELTTVSDQRLKELAQKEILANRLETLLNLLPGGVVVIDAHGMVTQANPASRELLNGPLLGCPWRQVIERNFSPKADDGHEVSTLDGRLYSIATRSLEAEGQLILLTDQTQTRKLQAEVSRNERLSSLGKMVSALAHQIRTPLSAALLYNSHIVKRADQPNAVLQSAEKTRGRLLDMERQVRDMLFFVRGDLVLSDHITVGELYNALREATEASLKDQQVECHWCVEAEQQRIQVNTHALVGAVSNLVENALQADVQKQPLQIRLEVFLQRSLAISVIDQGPGIPPEIAESLCDIFVTTKSQGTGIGLAVVQQVAKAHGGNFVIRSMAERGTRACLLLPVIQNKAGTKHLAGNPIPSGECNE